MSMLADIKRSDVVQVLRDLKPREQINLSCQADVHRADSGKLFIDANGICEVFDSDDAAVEALIAEWKRLGFAAE